MTPSYVSVSFSGGKDSTALLLGMIERKERIDEVVFCDTGLEFPQLYEHVNRIKGVLESLDIPFVTLKAEYDFKYYLLEKPIKSRKHPQHNGFGWPTPVIRWCTGVLKTRLVDSYYNSRDNVIRCIGLAADEQKRIMRTAGNDSIRYPLNEWGMTESQCLEYCYTKGYDWGGLYRIFTRVSCWCCPLQSIKDLKALYVNFPDLWQKLQYWESQINLNPAHSKVKFRDTLTIEDLTKRFSREIYAEKCQTKLTDYSLIEGGE